MIKIAGSVARPTTYPLYAGLSPGRKALLGTYENSRATRYEWASWDDFKGWAEEATGAIDPAESDIDPTELAEARVEKRRYEMAMNSQQLLGKIGSNAPLDGAPTTHLPNFDLHPDAPKRTFYVKGRSGHVGLHQMNSGASEPDNAARKARSQITIYTHPDTGKIHTHSNVAKDLIHSTTDTTANRDDGGPPPKKKKLTQKEKTERGHRNYGGYSNKDFATPSGVTPAKSTMRGHGNGFADTMPDPDVEEILLDGTTRDYGGNVGYRAKVDRRPGKSGVIKGAKYTSKTTNDNPLCYYAESDTNGGDDLGAKVKNHAHEQATRDSGGTYVQANGYSSTSTLLHGGMHIPDAVHYLRDVTGDTTPYASFKSGEKLTGDADDEWNDHEQPLADFPKPMQWDPSSQTLLDAFPDEVGYQFAPPTPYYLPESYEYVEEDVPGGMATHQVIPGIDGADQMAFDEVDPGTYGIGRFHPQFQQPH